MWHWQLAEAEGDRDRLLWRAVVAHPGTNPRCGPHASLHPRLCAGPRMDGGRHVAGVARCRRLLDRERARSRDADT
eukprot:scaffold8901_cov115-Isochrysis_galbana.AAC.6